jgi:hypothetical protein
VLCLCCAAWRWTRWWRWPSFCWPRYESLGWVTLRQSVNPWPPIYLLHDPISSSSCCRLVHLLLLLLHCAGAAWAYFHNQQEESAGCMGILSHTHLLLLLLHCAGAAVEGRLHGGGHAGGGGPAASCCKVSPPLPCPYLHSSLCSRSWPLFPFAATGRRHVPTSHPSACPFCCEFNLSPSFLSTALLSPLLLSISYRTLTLLPYMTVQEDEIIATVV